MRYAGIVWNLLLLAVAAAVCVYVFPLVAYQWTDLPWGGPSSFLARCIVIGVEGLRLVALAVLALGSAGTWAWRPVSNAVRWCYLLATAALLIGTGISETINRWDMPWRKSIDRDYVGFMLCVLIVVFPIIALGIGYPGLIVRLVTRSVAKLTSRREPV